MNNYCEPCKFKFRDRESFLTHVQTSHQAGSKTSNPAPTNIKIMDEETLLASYILASAVVRENYGLTRKERGGLIELVDHEKFLRLDNAIKERVKKAIEIANRRVKR